MVKADREARLATRVAALESKLSDERRPSFRPAGPSKTQAKQARTHLVRLLRQAVFLRNALVVEGLVTEQVSGGAGGGDGVGCWKDLTRLESEAANARNDACLLENARERCARYPKLRCYGDFERGGGVGQCEGGAGGGLTGRDILARRLG